MRFPSVIRTRRLVLRPWRTEDAAGLKALIDGNLDHLRAYMPWAMAEPSPIRMIEARIQKFAANFDADVEWIYGVFSATDETPIGGTGLHPRIEADGIEIGYWIDRLHVRRGLATEVARALTDCAFGDPDVQRVQIRCDPRNVPSAAVPRRLGFAHLTTLEANATTPTGEARDTMVWEMTRATACR